MLLACWALAGGGVGFYAGWHSGDSYIGNNSDGLLDKLVGGLMVGFFAALIAVAVVVLPLGTILDGLRDTRPQAQKHRREALPQRVRHEVWRRDQGRCVDCSSRDRLEYDHIIPVSRGGSNTARNVELRCERCNRSKGARV